MPRGTYGTGDIRAARAYVKRTFPKSEHGSRARDPSTWSRDYTLRVANVWRRQAAAGERPSLQVARRGPEFTAQRREQQARARANLRPGQKLRGGAGLEHPRQRYTGPRDERGRPDLRGSAGFYARQYRRQGPAFRFLSGLPAERVQIAGFGRLVEGYVPKNPDERGDVPQGFEPVWRLMFTGERRVAEELWPEIAAGNHVTENGDSTPLFERVQILEIRWGPGIG